MFELKLMNQHEERVHVTYAGGHIGAFVIDY